MLESIFKSMCGDTAKLYRRQWRRNGGRDESELVRVDENGYPCMVSDWIPVKTGDAAALKTDAELYICADAPLDEGMALRIGHSGSEKWFVTCGPVKRYPSHQTVTLRLERYI